MTVDFSTPQLFAGVFTLHTLKKYTTPRVMAKPRGDKAKPKNIGQSYVTFVHFSLVTKTVPTVTFAIFTYAWP